MPKCKSIDHMWRNPNRKNYYNNPGHPLVIPEKQSIELTVEECIARGICPECNSKLIFESGCLRCTCGWSAC